MLIGDELAVEANFSADSLLTNVDNDTCRYLRTSARVVLSGLERLR